MKSIEIRKLPELLIKKISEQSNIKILDWELLYKCIESLKENHSDKIFMEAPIPYIDIHNGTSGYIFIERYTDLLVYIYE